MLILEKNLVDSVESIHSVESEVHNRLIIFFPKAPNLLGTRFIFWFIWEQYITSVACDFFQVVSFTLKGSFVLFCYNKNKGNKYKRRWNMFNLFCISHCPLCCSNENGEFIIFITVIENNFLAVNNSFIVNVLLECARVDTAKAVIITLKER